MADRHFRMIGLYICSNWTFLVKCHMKNEISIMRDDAVFCENCQRSQNYLGCVEMFHAYQAFLSFESWFLNLAYFSRRELPYPVGRTELNRPKWFAIKTGVHQFVSGSAFSKSSVVKTCFVLRDLWRLRASPALLLLMQIERWLCFVTSRRASRSIQTSITHGATIF